MIEYLVWVVSGAMIGVCMAQMILYFENKYTGAEKMGEVLIVGIYDNRLAKKMKKAAKKQGKTVSQYVMELVADDLKDKPQNINVWKN